MDRLLVMPEGDVVLAVRTQDETGLDHPFTSRQADLPQQSPRFYRPELDAIRFIAFLAIFTFHAPPIASLQWLERAGFYGLPLFFFLSAFLITELLLREREATGTVHLKAFYMRRALRIWPLYYLGVFTALLWGWFVPQYRLSYHQLAYLVFFVGYIGKSLNANPAGVLWSVSIEELFYLVWPVLGKLNHFLFASFALMAASICSIATTSEFWYNPLTQFYYFSQGGLLALALHRKQFKLLPALRLVLFSLAIAIFLGALQIHSELIRFPMGGLACTLLLLSLLNIDPRWVPRFISYLGKISYGLYVFHMSCLTLVVFFVDRMQIAQHHNSLRAALIRPPALAMCILMAALSYRFFETPFLQLKRRFEFVKTRPV